jgi:putative ABC transport system permease protein
MWLVTRKGLLAHKLRLAMTALAVVLGVAFLAGTLVLTDTIERSFTDVITQTAGGMDAVVRPADSAPAFEGGFSQERPTVEPGVLDEVRAVDEVATADPVVTGTAQMIDPDGEPIGSMGAPNLGFNAPAQDGMGGTELREGGYPERDGEVAVDANTASLHDFAVGDTILVATGGPIEEFEIVGIVGFGESDDLAGATVAMFDLDTALERYSPTGEYDQIEVVAIDGVDAEQLTATLADLVSADLEVVSSQQIVEEDTEAIGQALAGFSTGLLVFAGVSLFVGIFIIVNTFSITVAQRVREFALLRAVGASRRQVLGSVLTEAGVLGLFGSLVGLGLGVVLAIGLQALLDAVGLELPAEGLVFAPRTVAVALVVGVAVTMLAAVGPALKATRIAPVQALQASAAPPAGREGWVRSVLGGVVTVVGVGLMVAGLFGDAGVPVLGGGAVAVFVGIALLSPMVVRPLMSALGWPIARLTGLRGELARENAMRNPRRTATTASALMIGVGLVGFVTIFGTSISSSLSDAVDDAYVMDFDVRSTSFQPISGQIGEDLAELEEVGLALTQRLAMMEVAGDDEFAVGADMERIDRVYDLEVLEGSYADVAEGGGIAVSERAAEGRDVGLGDELEITFSAGGEVSLPVLAIFDGYGVDVHYMLDTSTYREHHRSDEAFAVGVVLADGVDFEEGRAAVDEVLDAYPGVQAQDLTGVREQLTGQIDQLVALVYGLLALAVIIAFFGIVNTLALSVFERVREIGLLRAVGMTRSQVRGMVRWESALISALGVLLGLAIGVLFGWLMVEGLQDLFPIRLVVPVGQLAVAVVVAVLVGVLAGVLPARRAARVDVLEAVTSE